MSHLTEVVARSIALREASASLRGRAVALRKQATGTRAIAALTWRRTRVCWIGGGADEAVPGSVPEPVRACHRCAEPIDDLDPVVVADDGDAVHVRCWRPPDPVGAPVPPFEESPMPPLEAFRSRPGRPPRRQPYEPARKVS